MKKFNIIWLLFFPSLLSGQNIHVKQSLSDSDNPEITWFTTGRIDTTEFQIFRSVPKEKNFTRINTIHFAHVINNSDTTEFTLIDTTLLTKGIYAYYIQIKRNGKTENSETAIAHNFGLIPKPHLTSFISTALKDRKAIELSWNLDNAATVSSMSLYRSEYYDTAYIKIAELAPDMNSFIDVVPVANEPLYYFILIHDFFGNQYPSVRSPAFATFAEKPIRPQNISGHFSNDSIIIKWSNTGSNIIGYRVFRSIDKKAFHVVNDMAKNISKEQLFVDAGNDISTATRLEYYVRNVSDGFLESNSSDTLSFYIAEHEKVLPPAELDYFIDKNNNIKLLWITPKEGFVLGYNVYLENPQGGTKKLNDEIIKLNSFIDSTYRPAGKYTYFLESVGVNNKTSKNTVNTTVYKYSSRIHIILDLKKQPDGILVSWKMPLDNHITELQLYRQYGDNKAVLIKSFSNGDDVTYLDKDLVRGNTYYYKLLATAQNGEKIIVNEGVEMNW